MKKIIFAAMISVLMLASACQKEKVVKPVHKAGTQLMDSDSSDTGTTDPTIPPPHGN